MINAPNELASGYQIVTVDFKDSHDLKDVILHAVLQTMNCLLILNGWFWLIEILQVKYLSNITGSSRN